MKKLIVTLCFGLLALSSFSQASNDTLTLVKDLIKKQQYLTAYDILFSYTKDDVGIPVILTDLLLEHSNGTNDQLDKWVLENKAFDGRQEKETVDMPLEKALLYFIKMYPNNCELNGSLSKVYIYYIARKDLYIELDELKGINDYVEKQVHSKCPDAWSNFVMGYSNTYLGNPQKAIGQLQKTITEKPNYGEAYLQIGKSYLQTKDYQKALVSAKKCYDLETKRSKKAYAALLMGQAYEALNDNNNALKNYITADTLMRKDFFIQQALLNFYVKTNNSNAPDALNSFIGAQNRNASACLDALDIYSAYGKQMDLAVWFQKALGEDPKRSGAPAYNFTLGKIYQTINKDMAREYFKKAKELGLKSSSYVVTRNHPKTVKTIEEAFATIN